MRALFVWVVAGLGLASLAAGCGGGGGGGSSGGGGEKGSGAKDGGGASSAKNKAFAECCASDSECASGVCSPKHLACSLACTTDDECPPEPKSGKASCSQSSGVCQAERTDVTCEPHTGSGGQSGGGSGGDAASGAGGASGAGSGGTKTGSGGSNTGGGSSTGGASNGAPHLVQCTQIAKKEPFNNTTSSDICRCRADTNGGMISYRGDQACGQGDTDLFCCGEGGYPDSGSCTCYQKRSWQCFEGGSGASAFCQCWYYGNKATAASQVPTSSCDLTTKTYATRCYVFDVTGGQRCQCDARALPSGARQVPGCSTAKDAAVTVPTACPASTTAVDTCSRNLYVPPASGCGPSCSGTMCVGDSLCCNYSCDGDSCVQHCNF